MRQQGLGGGGYREFQNKLPKWPDPSGVVPWAGTEQWLPVSPSVVGNLWIRNYPGETPIGSSVTVFPERFK